MRECGKDGGEAGETQKVPGGSELDNADSDAGQVEQNSAARDLSRNQMEQFQETLACYVTRMGWRIGQDSGNPCPPVPSSAYIGYFERQIEARCGMHALNNAIGQPTITTAMMRATPLRKGLRMTSRMGGTL